MEFLILIGVIFVISFIYEKLKGSSSSNTNSSQSTYQSNSKSNTVKNPNAYRPKKTPTKKINFGESNNIQTNTSNNNEIKQEDLKDLNDAFTGAPLDLKLGLFRCNNCQVYYHTSSYEILVSENNKQCMSCGSLDITSVNGIKTGARNARVDVITLDNYKNHLGRVITFEGHVYTVNESRRGNDFAVMFENKSWTRGFKLVFFRGSISKCGGKTYINSLKGKNIKVRGLLKHHPKFGYEIVISEKSQILKVN